VGLVGNPVSSLGCYTYIKKFFFLNVYIKKF
jgi:hypothetical protein